MNNITTLAKELNKTMMQNTYSFEIDTEDIVFGFKKTMKKRTKSMAKAISMKVKLMNDSGHFISDCVVIREVRYYINGELKRTF